MQKCQDEFESLNPPPFSPVVFTRGAVIMIGVETALLIIGISVCACVLYRKHRRREGCKIDAVEDTRRNFFDHPESQIGK